MLNVKDGRLDYLIRDVHNGLRGNTLTISLNVEYMPVVGGFFKVIDCLDSHDSTQPNTQCQSNILMLHHADHLMS